MDIYAVASVGTFPTPGITSAQRAAAWLTHGLFVGSLPTPAPGARPVQGTIVVKLRFGYGYAELPASDCGILSADGNAKSLLYNTVGGVFRSFDGSTVASSAAKEHTAGEEIKVAVLYGYDDGGTSKFKVGVEVDNAMSWGTAQVFDDFDVGSYLVALKDMFGPTWISTIHVDNQVWSDSKILAI